MCFHLDYYFFYFYESQSYLTLLDRDSKIHDLSLNVLDESDAVSEWVRIFYTCRMFPKDV